jgi:hypothetical protein
MVISEENKPEPIDIQGFEYDEVKKLMECCKKKLQQEDTKNRKNRVLEALLYIKEFVRRMFANQHEINLFVARTGGGKSTIATAMMYKIYKENKKRIKRGKTPLNIYTNIGTSFPTISVTKENLVDGELQNGYLFFDEASVGFNNRQFKKFSQDDQEFFRFHRKNKLEVCLFSQSNADTDKVIRSLVHNEFLLRKFLWWIIVIPVSLTTGIDPITQDWQDKREIRSIFSAKFYCWVRWSFYFDTTQRSK